nr:unnamed protein product [Callosobruchus analis]
MEEIKEFMKTIMYDIKEIRKENQEFKNEIRALKQENSELKNEMAELKKRITQLESIEEKMEQEDRMKRKNNLVISGLKSEHTGKEITCNTIEDLLEQHVRVKAKSRKRKPFSQIPAEELTANCKRPRDEDNNNFEVKYSD